jgi:O-antigen/teichoic acid export membrane protein
MAGASLLNKAWWTTAMFGASFGLKIASNVVLSRLLAPEIFGVMVIVNSIRVGVELLTDVGVEQNIVHAPDGLERRFFDTAWTLQVLRGALLTGLFLLMAPWLAGYYRIDRDVLFLISFAPLLNGFASTALYALAKRLEVKRRNLFELSAEATNFVVCVTLALVTPTVWALVGGALAAIAARAGLSHLLLSPRPRFRLDGEVTRRIIGYGKWIMVTSLLMYASTNLDRLYLGRIAPFAILGVFGIARTIADLPTMLARRLSYQIIFPFLAHSGDAGREPALAELRAARLKFVLAAAALLGGFVGSADWAIRIVYDPRYLEAGWMLAVLMVGAWFSVLSNLNEALVLGAGRPAFSTAANVSRLAVLAVGLPLGYAAAGYLGVLLAVVASEASQYLVMGVGQQRVGLTFRRQDLAATALFAALAGGTWLARAGIGLPFDWGHALG